MNNKQTTIIIIFVIVFIVIGVVVYMFAQSNKDDSGVTKTKTTSGLGNIFANSPGGIVGLLMGNKTPKTEPKS